MVTDDELLAAYAEGSELALRELVDRYRSLVRAIARGYGLRGPDVDDIEQITFAVLARKAMTLTPDSCLAAWLSTIARRHTWRVLERERRHSASSIDDVSPVYSSVDDSTSALAEAEWLREGLRRMPSRCRALLEALFLRPDEPSYVELSKEFGLPIGSIGPTRARCLEQLRRILAESESGREMRGKVRS